MMFLYGDKHKPVRRINGRYFAIPKPATLTERIHARTLERGDLPRWHRVMSSPVGSTVICNQKRADGRRSSMWSRKVTPALFAGRT